MPHPTVGVTGANGFIGRALCEALAARARIVALSRRPPERWPAGGEWRRAPDLADDGASWRGVLVGVDVLVHLAAVAHVRGRLEPSAEASVWQVNARAPVELARACVAVGVRRMVFLSSIKALAERSSEALRVDAPPRPEDVYGRAKQAAEQGIRQVAAESTLETAIVRCPLVYGTAAQGNLQAIARALARGIPLPFASIRNRRSLVARSTLCGALAHLAVSPLPHSATYHVADRQPYTTADIVRLVARMNGLTPRLFACPGWLLRGLLVAAGRRAAADRLLGSLELETESSYARMQWAPPTAGEPP